MRVDGYAPIRDYAAIGDGRTTALVARDGSIDWLCFPERDSPTVFGALLDPARGGRFALVPRERFEVARRYLLETNVLETTYTTAEGTARVTDLMTLQDGGLPPWTELVRKVEGLSGRVSFSWSVEPRFGHGLEKTSLEVCDGIPLATSGAETLAVSSSDAGDPSVENSAVGGAFAVREGRTAVIALSGVHDRPVHLQPRDAVERRIKGTVSTWKRWLQARDGAYEGPWKDDVLRSVLALELLINTTGAITAAATSSLPERIGGDKNYDYRYGWARDSAFTLDALLHLGYHEQAHLSFTFLRDALESAHPRVQPIYTIRGEPLERERQLDVLTQSRMAAWETFDRALALVANGQLPAAHAGAWRRTAEAIEGWIEANCWSETQRSYTIYRAPRRSTPVVSSQRGCSTVIRPGSGASQRSSLYAASSGAARFSTAACPRRRGRSFRVPSAGRVACPRRSGRRGGRAHGRDGRTRQRRRALRGADRA